MKNLITSFVLQLILLFLLLKEDRNDGEKELFKKQKWDASDVVIVVLSIGILNFLIVSLFKFQFLGEFLRKSYLFYVPLFLFFLIVILFRFKFRQNIRVLGFTKTNLKRNIFLGILVAAINLAISSIFYFLFAKPGTHALPVIGVLRNFKNISYYLPYFFVLFSTILAPVVEESIFRGILYSPYRKKYGPTCAIIITSLFFATFHHRGILHYFINGFFWGILYEKTESIVSSIVAHSIYNLIFFIVMLYFAGFMG
ncbi:MAG: CPBP family intramembrane metalloprotease [Candidatus Aenigmarchaeota archaeon]|nr:CPBP family intramembrane metalloprotease [Candidatus Aenigmarchaeota archaeon]